MITALDNNTALVLIDLQKSIVGNPLIKSAPVLLEKVGELVLGFRRAGLPIVVVNVNPAGAAWTRARKDLNAPPPTPQEGATDIVPEVKTQPDDIFITKHTWGAFFETRLQEELASRNITGIVLAGISTSIGVEATARQASERAYNISFAQDAMADTVPEAHERSMKYIFPRIGEVGDARQIVLKLLERE